MMTEKKCYDCVHRGEVPGSAHSSCNHPMTQATKRSPFMQLAGTVGKRGGDQLMAMASAFGEGPQRAADALHIRANYHGIKNGWFVWPVNFDPVWLDNCDGFTAREEPARERAQQALDRYDQRTSMSPAYLVEEVADALRILLAEAPRVEPPPEELQPADAIYLSDLAADHAAQVTAGSESLEHALRTVAVCGYDRGEARVEPPPHAEWHKLDTDTHVYFYEQDFYVLSNFSAFRLDWKGVRFDTSEAAYHWEKFPHRPDLQGAIQQAASAHSAFKYGERHRRERRHDWDTVKVSIMREILTAKVEQHEYVRRKLLATGTRTLVEDSWRDDFWGWGPRRDGQNMLGHLWMEIRDRLRAPVPAAGEEPSR